MTAVNQKEYLKKYLKIGKSHGTKKKRKKTENALGKRLKIIDDDMDVSLSEEIKEDLAGANEDAPQIVSIIDDRPLSLKNKLWKPITEADSVMEAPNAGSSTGNYSNLALATQSRQDLDHSPVRSSKPISTKQFSPTIISPTRIKSEYSPQRTELSPQGRERTADHSPRRRKSNSKDLSPRRQENSDSRDNSPLRRTNKNSDHSPKHRKYCNSEDQSPRRRKNSEGNYLPKQRRNSDSEDQSPKRQRYGDQGDQSPIRRKTTDAPEGKRGYDKRDMSPKRRKNEEDGYSHKKDTQTEKSRKDSSRQKISRWADNSPDSSGANIGKAEKTLSGKKSGLQNAKDLIQELNSLRERENELFGKMTAEVSGVNAATISRKKKTTTPEEDAEQQRKQRELEEKYSRWGKGLKQVEDRDEKVAEQLHEMSKPLARYADDEDLERYQKEQLLEGDPMLMYMRKKKKKQAVEAGIPDKPVYMGDFMPNRYGIRPGYRWDGVDRSNGYELKLFQAKNSEKASLEEALMWNTEDM